ncbi:DUF4244 domain-containing protein [Specibacter sp. NPDC057265]|uniref:DUF4244 domain-containing protein n=1 Tax=Specibacter sp. NPDC057265 TaxID=3346075 RepID=UPI003628AD62
MNSHEPLPQLQAPAPRAITEIFPGASRRRAVNNPGPHPPRARSRWLRGGLEAGMATAEYAIATLAAVGFAGLLVVILKSDEVRGFLLNIIRTALSM